MPDSKHNRTREPNRASTVPDDPTVEEIRDIRRRLWESAGRDVHRYIRETRESVRRIKSVTDASHTPREGRS